MMKRYASAALAVALFAALSTAPAMAQASKKAAPGKEQAAPTEPAAKEPSAKQKAARERMKHCGAEWQTMKKENKTKGLTWRQFSSQCLKGKS